MSLDLAPADLSNCDREPIHIIGRIQSFGFLLVLSPEWIITHASRNISEYTQRSAESLIGCGAGEILSEEAMHTLRSRLQMLATPDATERTFELDLLGDGKLLDVALHMSGRKIVLEAEVASTEAFHHYINYVRPMAERVKQGETTVKMCSIAARQLRALTGIDRVMVYRFAEDGSGEVIAESRAHTVDGFMGLHFPMTDIPAQARALYMKNMLRIIGDIDDPTVEIVPQLDAYGKPLDLTMSTLRAISPIHIEYLRNMGVRASLSVSIIREGKLWGLFACHHYAPLHLSYPLRTAVELFGELFAYMLDQSESVHSRELAKRSADLHNRLMARLAVGRTLLEDFEPFSAEISSVIPYDGIVCYVDGQFLSRGEVPTPAEFEGLVRFLNTAGTGEIWCTDHLAAFHPPAHSYAARCAGLLALPVSRLPRDYLILFRSEIARDVRWAGKPNKVREVGPHGERLTPRKSFEEWKQIVTGHCQPWTDDEKHCAEYLRVTMLEVVLRLAENSNRELDAAGERQEILIAELNHRVRNILNLIRSLINQSRPQFGTIDDYAEILGSRVEALARAHDQLTIGDWSPTPIRQLIAVEASSWLKNDLDRISVEGAYAIVQPRALTTLALVLHELMTNSSKYGALSAAGGKVVIRLSRGEDDSLEIVWTETGGPPVKPPERRGFGSALIERSIPHELAGAAEIVYHPSGLVARFTLPPACIESFPDTASKAVDKHSVEVADTAVPSALPATALLVEDNVLIAIETEDILSYAGVEHILVASNVAKALQLLNDNAVGFAIVDVNLGRETSEPIAEYLKKRNIPFLLATGYGDSLPPSPGFLNVPVLKKPYSRASLLHLLFTILAV